MSNKSEKIKVKELLIKRDLEEIRNWADNNRNPQRVLLSLAYDTEELVMWRAVEAVGRVAAMWAKNNLKKIRNLIRQQLWLMNDESGGLGWHSPEIIGEILVNVPGLINEYAPLFLSYLDEEPFERGSHLAVYRVASVDPKPFAGRVDELAKSLNRSDKYICAYTLLALGEIDLSRLKKAGERFGTDTEKIRIYNFETGLMETTDLSKVVGKLLDKEKTSINAV